MKRPTVTIRFRKGSATYVIYLSGKILESGFDSVADAMGYLEAKHHGLIGYAKVDVCLGAGF